MIAVWPFGGKNLLTLDLFDCSRSHSTFSLPPASRSFPCCNRNEHPWGPLRNTNGTSFEESSTWLWVHRRTRQCYCCRYDKKRRESPRQGQQEAMNDLGNQEADIVARLFIYFLICVHFLFFFFLSILPASSTLLLPRFPELHDSQSHRSGFWSDEFNQHLLGSVDRE